LFFYPFGEKGTPAGDAGQLIYKKTVHHTLLKYFYQRIYAFNAIAGQSKHKKTRLLPGFMT
jgi:hypothetical protein